ncbi:MAG: glycosyltransferase family 2 protein [Candidatus Thiodiazotropha sp.]|jgi:glycosyltransferase involved in cell wall biosynthesis
MRIAAVIPVYNEVATIRSVVERTLHHVDQLIVVDDASVDGSAEELAGITGITLLTHSRNLGKGSSIQLGFNYALQQGFDAVITLDGDNQHSPEEIPGLLRVAEEHPNAIVIAARLKQRENAPKLRLFANKFADFWVSWAAGYTVVDSQSGFRLYPSQVLKLVCNRLANAKGFVFESEILIEAAHNNLYSVSVPIESIYHQGGRHSHYKPWKDTWLIVRMIAGKLLRMWMYPQGLLRVIHLLPDPRRR